MKIDRYPAMHQPSEEEMVLVSHSQDLIRAEDHDRRASRERRIATLRLLWMDRLFLFKVGTLGLVLSILIAFLIPRRFTSTARLMPPDNQSASGLAMAAAALTDKAGGELGSIAGDLLGFKNTSDLFVGILTSRTAQDALIEKFDLRKVYRDRRMEDARDDLADRTSIDVDRKTQIITIKVTDKSPARAAAMAQAYVEQLNDLVANLSTSGARRERIFLEGRLAGVSQDLEAAEKHFADFASKNTAINVPEQGKAMLGAAATLEGELIAAQSELEGLRQIYTDNNVRVQSVQARVDELRHQVEKLAGKGEDVSVSANQQNESPYPSMRKLPLLGVTYADLYRQARVQEAVYETLTQEYEIAKVQEAKEIPTVKVLDAPDIPEKKSFPPRTLIIGMGTILAVAVGAIWILIMQAWKDTDPLDPRKAFAIEVFGVVRTKLREISPNGTSQREIANSQSDHRKGGTGIATPE
jgi:capsule polysaccharide export protein KpsE/RkpR